MGRNGWLAWARIGGTKPRIQVAEQLGATPPKHPCLWHLGSSVRADIITRIKTLERMPSADRDSPSSSS